MDKVVHFEIPADKVERAQEFYKKTFGWGIQSIPEMQYTIVRTVEVDDKQMPKESGAINGGMMKRNDSVKSPIITINVENIDDSLKMIEENGGKIIMAKQKVGEMGFNAYFQDSEGNVLGVWQALNWHK